MKDKYLSPKIVIEPLEKKDVLCQSDLDNITYGAAGKMSVNDLLDSIGDDFGFSD